MKPKLYLSTSTQEKNIGVDSVTEEERMFDLGDDLAAILRPYVIIMRNTKEMHLIDIIEESNEWRSDFHLALHSNAMGGKRKGQASGVETWVHIDSVGGHRMAEILVPKLAAAQGIKIRKDNDKSPLAKESRQDGSIVSEVDLTNAPACLVEIFFHDNIKDIEAHKANRDRVLWTLNDGVLEYFKRVVA